MNLYELNQGMYANVPPMTESGVRTVIKEYLEKHLSNYYLMLNHDIHYYTVFTQDKESAVLLKAVQTVWNIVRNLGEVVDAVIDPNNGMLEFWIRQKDKKVLMFGFFDYERGVVKL